MATWNNDYNKTPRNGYNPGYGAQEFRLLKTNLVDRLRREHGFGQDETDNSILGGYHKEGSTRFFVEDSSSATSARTLNKVASIGEVGQGFIDVQERVDALEQNEVEQESNEAVFNHKLYANVSLDHLDPTTLTKELIFDYDDLVNTTFDQDIYGIKTFQNSINLGTVPSANIIKATEDADPAFPPVVAPVSIEVAVPLSQLRERLVDAKEHNILAGTGVDGAYNTTEVVDGYTYTMHDISCQTIRAKNIYGAVWG